MDGENNGSKPYFLMDDLGGKNPYFWFNTHINWFSRLISEPSTVFTQKISSFGGF